MKLHVIQCADCHSTFNGVTAKFCGKCRRKGERAGAAVKGFKNGAKQRGTLSQITSEAICPFCSTRHRVNYDCTVRGKPGRIFCRAHEYLRDKDCETNSVGYW
jgi:hypothetical protein